MEKDSKIYIAGHRGLVGSALVRRLTEPGYMNLIVRTHAELDLTRQTEVEDFFKREHPEYVFLAAAKVGGILANNTYPAEFIYSNIVVQSNVIHSSYLFGVKKVLFLGSSCIYPRDCPQPMKEDYLLSGYLEPTNEPYAIAKIAGIKMCQAYNRQYGANFISVMPTNLYGPNDNFDIQNAHVLPALIRKFHEAKVAGQKEVVVWGTGSPRREFLYVDDLADACIFLMNNYNNSPEIINIGVGKDISIRELALMVKEIVDYNGEIVFDTSKPDGTPRKLLDVSKLSSLGWQAKTGLREGIKRTYQWYVEMLKQI
ncbi:MAG: GDP-fucose synthetase [Nitrospirae bacterium CG_4_10_14_0_8_um_filter_41_23]|nr:MAG: GDP-fucose synthetase [Nitrospirae bacterium CG11_big_fil_rev_8_21_14_0_20_41_14]PIY87166.1 MAG: GDP-fucose synthetase [Nitrospirae bacterium CG_4_10_14_0_8_um_filter_41_23]PJA81011.1 MAG: GDP-fucose synthetase [Nitrospirae bacterium CG_4_9_14_3_um_filter_41_27]